MKRFFGKRKIKYNRTRALLFIIFAIIVITIGYSVYLVVARFESQVWQSRQKDIGERTAERVAYFTWRIQDFLILYTYVDPAKQPPPMIPELLEIIHLDENQQIIKIDTVPNEETLLTNPFTLKQAQWFIDALAGTPYVSDVRITATNRPYVIMSVPAPEGGVVATRIDMRTLWEQISTIRLGKTGISYIVNESSQIVAHPNPEIAFANTLLTSPQGTQRIRTEVEGTEWVVITEISSTEAIRIANTILWSDIALALTLWTFFLIRVGPSTWVSLKQRLWPERLDVTIDKADTELAVQAITGTEEFSQLEIQAAEFRNRRKERQQRKTETLEISSLKAELSKKTSSEI